MGELRSRTQQQCAGLDAYAKKADTYFQEMLMLATKVDRHEKWLHQMTEKLGVSPRRSGAGSAAAARLTTAGSGSRRPGGRGSGGTRR